MFIKDRNKFPELKKRVKELTRKKIHVGILGNAELAVVARSNEYGAKITISEKMRNYLNYLGLHLKKTTKYIIIPERSFFRTSFDSKKNQNRIMDIAESITDLSVPVKMITEKVGLFMTGAIQAKIKTNIPPGNHPFTTEQKGGKNKTLVNTGRLSQGISHRTV
jgi:hypothetical protein